MGSSLIVRPARVQDVAQMAGVHVRCWQETYRGLMPDAVLDDPGFLAARERMWTAVLTGERYRQNRVAVAARNAEMIGIAMSGPAEDAAAAWTRQLYALYVYAAEHGTGAGRALLEAVIDPAESAALWVADPNPRAQAFYRKHGFVADGTAQVQDGVRAIRMVRDEQHCGTGRADVRQVVLGSRASGPSATSHQGGRNVTHCRTSPGGRMVARQSTEDRVPLSRLKLTDIVDRWGL